MKYSYDWEECFFDQDGTIFLEQRAALKVFGVEQSKSQGVLSWRQTYLVEFYRIQLFS
jgi:hypothetical protein